MSNHESFCGGNHVDGLCMPEEAAPNTCPTRMHKIWIIAWSTESADEGIFGYWDKKPEREQILAYLRDHLTDDYEAGTLHYRLKELSIIDGK